MGVLPRHQNFQHILLFIRKWICALELFLSEMLHQTLESHATHLNQLPLWWHLLACSTVKAASHDGSSVVPIYFSQTDVVCSSLLCYFLDSPGLYYSIFHWLKLHLFGSHSWVLFFSLHSSTSSVHYFFFPLSEYAKRIFLFLPIVKNELSLADLFCTRKGHQVSQTVFLCYQLKNCAVMSIWKNIRGCLGPNVL